MKVIALNSSPRGEGISKTGVLLDALVEGMREAGAEVETIHLRQKKINNCMGCFTCWTKSPGVCIHKDDMSRELFPKWLEADIAVYATPLYHFTVNASMKAFIERTLPFLEPFLIKVDGKTFHPLRQIPRQQWCYLQQGSRSNPCLNSSPHTLTSCSARVCWRKSTGRRPKC